jgi:hypothetical protein
MSDSDSETIQSESKSDSESESDYQSDDRYKKGKIYSFSFQDKIIYIGSTIKSLKDRLNVHKNDSQKSKSALYTFINEKGGFDNIKMNLIENYQCNSRRELEQREQFYIEKYDNLLNSHNAFTDQKEYRKQYYQKNKEHDLEYQKKYNEIHKEKIKEYQLDYQKKYYEEHKKEIITYKTEHQKEYHKIYQQKNREEINRQQRERRAKKKAEKEKAEKMIFFGNI